MSGYADDLPPSCGGQGSDRFYRVHVNELSEFTATVEGGSIRPAVSLWPACGASAPTDCRASLVTGTAATLPRRVLTPGDWLIAVEDVNGLGAPFTLRASLRPPSGSRCELAIPIELIGGTRTVTGDTTGAENDRPVSCTSLPSGGDVTHTLGLAERSRLDVTVHPTSGTLFAPAIEVLSGTCSNPTVHACDTTTANLPSRVITGVLDAGTYSLWIDSFYPGTYSMSVVAKPEVPGDTCGNVLASTLAAPTRLESELHDAFSDVTLACGPSGRDVGYRFTAAQGQYFAATMTSLDGGAATVELRGPGATCPGSTNLADVTCRTGARSARVARNPLSAGTYYLWLKGNGAFALDMTLSAALPGDRCTDPLPLGFSNGAASVSGSTLDALADIAEPFGCGRSALPDVVYSFTVQSPQMFSATITAPGRLPELHLRSTCTVGLDLACAAAQAGQDTVTVGPTALMPGTYFLVVDTVTPGDFTLSATLQ